MWDWRGGEGLVLLGFCPIHLTGRIARPTNVVCYNGVFVVVFFLLCSTVFCYIHE